MNEESVYAVANIEGDISTPNLKGIAYFKPFKDGTMVEVEVSGLPGYKNYELTIYTPTKEIYDEEVCIELIEENNVTVIDSESFYVYLTEQETTTEKFADRNPSGISVYLNGEKLSFDVQPQIINGRTMHGQHNHNIYSL